MRITCAVHIVNCLKACQTLRLRRAPFHFVGLDCHNFLESQMDCSPLLGVPCEFGIVRFYLSLDWCCRMGAYDFLPCVVGVLACVLMHVEKTSRGQLWEKANLADFGNPPRCSWFGPWPSFISMGGGALEGKG